MLLPQIDAAFTYPYVEPRNTGSDNMRRQYPNRSLLWRGTQGKLLCCQWRDGRDKMLLIDIPTLVEGESES